MPSATVAHNTSMVPLALALAASAALHALAMSLLPAAPLVADDRASITVSLHSAASKLADTAPAAGSTSPEPSTAALPLPVPDSAPSIEVSAKQNDKPQPLPLDQLASRTPIPAPALPAEPLDNPARTPPTAAKPTQARAPGDQRHPTRPATKHPTNKPTTPIASSRPRTTRLKRSPPAKPVRGGASVTTRQRPRTTGQHPAATATAATGSGIGSGSGIATVTADGASRPPPRYPSRARRRGQQGRVVLLVQVGASGAVTRLQVSHSSGHRLLDRAALKTVKGWRFADHGGQRVRVPIVFRLEG